MPDSAQHSHLQRRREISAGEWIGNGFIALLPVLACFLGGGSQKWAEGVVAGLLGLFLIARPPRSSLGWGTNLALLGLVAVGALAFSPADWFFLPAWRAVLVNDFSIVLPSTLTPQPWVTGSCLVSLVAGIAWLYVVCTEEIGLRAAQFQLRLFVVGVVFLAALCLVFYWAHAAFPFWKNERGFGTFPNRNHTANLFAITAIVLLACGQDDIRRGRKTWAIWLVGLAILIAAVILAYSRAGVVLLVGGCALWIGLVALRQRSPAPVALGLSFLLLLLTALLLLGGQTLERFHLRGLEGPGITTDFRWRVFHDAFQLIQASPWCGIGLGNFSAIFAMFRMESTANARALHPESDWLWLWSELGWPAVVLVIVAGALLIRRVFPLREGTNQRFRLAAFIAALLVSLHGLIDVPGHKIGTGFAALFLLGLSLHRPLHLNASLFVLWFFRLIGLLLLASGMTWILTTRQQMLLPSSLGADNAKHLSEVANRGRNFAETIRLTTRALEWAPLDWQLYFARASAEIAARQPAAALEDFRRARFLEPNAYDLPLAEGNVWAASNPILATTAWREALRRAGKDRAYVYGAILRNAPKNDPSILRLLEETGFEQPDLAVAYLAELAGSAFDQAVKKLLERDPDLQALSEPQKLALFAKWSDQGNRDQLAQAVTQHSDWLQYAWFGMAKHYADKSDFRAAYELTQRFGQPAALPWLPDNGGESIDELKKRFYAGADNAAVGYALYRKQKQRGQIDDALQTTRHLTERANSPIYFRYLEAELWAAKGNWERAWKAWYGFWSAQTRAGAK